MEGLPDNVVDLLRILITQYAVLGALASLILEGIFRWYEGFRGPIPTHIKGVISVVTPPLFALAAYLILAGIGAVHWSTEELAQALYVGIKASLGAQTVYHLVRSVGESGSKTYPPTTMRTGRNSPKVER